LASINSLSAIFLSHTVELQHEPTASTLLPALPLPLPSRRYPIEELAAEGDFIDSTFLLLHGELPSKQVGMLCVLLSGC
jgi:hypothetical protein